MIRNVNTKDTKMETEKLIKPTLKLIKGYAYGNKIERADLMAVLYLSKDINAREMFKLILNEGLIELIKGNPRFPDEEDEFKISEKGFNLLEED